MTDTKLLPCPFCGSKDVMMGARANNDWEATCMVCGVYRCGTTYDEAVTRWNTRSGASPSAPETCASYRAALEAADRELDYASGEHAHRARKIIREALK